MHEAGTRVELGPAGSPVGQDGRRRPREEAEHHAALGPGKNQREFIHSIH